MGFNRAVVKQRRALKDQQARAQARANRGARMPFIQPKELIDGAFRIRLWPTHEKNPHGFLYYASHAYLHGYGSPDKTIAQCPRSNNWDPLPYMEDEHGDPIYKERCLACEIREWVYEPELDTAGNIVTPPLYDQFPESLQSVCDTLIGTGFMAPANFYPATIKAKIHAREKRESAAGKVYEVVTYEPDPETEMYIILKLEDGKIYERQLMDLIAQCEDLNDPITGRWLTLTKANGGKGPGGYNWSYDPHPSQFDNYDYSQVADFRKWGAGNRSKPSRRIPFVEQIALVETTDWGKDLQKFGVPIRDEDTLDPDDIPF